MQKGAKITLGIIGVLAVIGIAGGSGGSKNKDEVSKVGEVSESSENQSEDTADEATSAKPSEDNKDSAKSTEVSEKSEYTVGDTAETKYLRIVYLSSGEYVSDNKFLQPKDGYKYIYANLYFENLSSSDQSVTFYDFDCYADGYACDAFYYDEDELSATLSAGRSVSGKVYFEVPTDAKDIQIEYEENVFTDKKIKFVYEGDKDSGIVPEANTASSENAFNVGDIVETKSLRISYLSCGDHVSDDQFTQPAEGKKFIYGEFEFENISDSDEYISIYSFDCFADGSNCDMHYAEDDTLSATISAGRKVKGNVYFEVPVDAQTIEIEYLDNFWTSGRVVFAYS